MKYDDSNVCARSDPNDCVPMHSVWYSSCTFSRAYYTHQHSHTLLYIHMRTLSRKYYVQVHRSYRLIIFQHSLANVWSWLALLFLLRFFAAFFRWKADFFEPISDNCGESGVGRIQIFRTMRTFHGMRPNDNTSEGNFCILLLMRLDFWVISFFMSIFVKHCESIWDEMVQHNRFVFFSLILRHCFNFQRKIKMRLFRELKVDVTLWNAYFECCTLKCCIFFSSPVRDFLAPPI